MEQQNKHGVKLGIFIFIGLTFFIVGVLAIGNINKTFTKTATVTTVFTEVNGLQPGDNIWFSGVKVGTVKEMRFLPNAGVEVTMKIESKSQEFIPKDSKAKISSDGLIGNKIIVIYGGNPTAGHIVNGSTFSIEETTSTEDMMNMLQENNKNVLAITNDFKVISKRIADGEGTLGKFMTDDAIYENLNLTISTLKTASQNTVQLTNAINDFTTKLNADGGLANDLATDTTVFNNIQKTVAQLNAIAGTAQQVADNLQTTTSDINTNKNSPAGVLLHDEEAAASLRASIIALESSTQKLNESMDALQHNFLLRGFFKKKDKEKDPE